MLCALHLNVDGVGIEVLNRYSAVSYNHLREVYHLRIDFVKGLGFCG